MGKTPADPTTEQTRTDPETTAPQGEPASTPASTPDARGDAPEERPLADLTPEILQALGEEIALEFPTPVDDTTLVLMEVDPHRVHAFWHVGEADLERARQRLGPAAPLELILRVQDVTPAQAGAEPGEPFDIRVQGRDSHCYVDLWQDGRSYEAELAVRGRDGTLVPLVRSNRVATPPAAPEPATHAAPQATQAPAAAAQPVPPAARGVPFAQADARAVLEGYFGPTAHSLGEATVAPALPVDGRPGEGHAAAVAEDDSGRSEPALQPPDPATLTPEFPNPFPGAAGELAAVEATAGAAWLPPLGVPRAEGGRPASGADAGGEPRAGDTPTGAAHPTLGLSSSSLVGSPGLLEVHAELHVFGWVRPGSRLRVFGRPVALRPDGSFSVRRPLPAGAVVVPLEVQEPPASAEAEPD